VSDICVDDDDSGSEAGPSKVAAPVEEAEYSDGDQLATVTITEDFDPSSSSFRPLAGASSSSPPPASASSRPAIPDMPASSHKAQTKAKKERERLKEKKKSENDRSRSMETKSERKKGREFEAKRRAKKAGMALERDGRRPRGMKAKGKGGGKRR
jgi:ribosomal RNA-processing protein 17